MSLRFLPVLVSLLGIAAYTATVPSAVAAKAPRQVWKPTKPIPKEVLVTQTTWGNGPRQIGINLPKQCQDCDVASGIRRFAVDGKEVFLMDSVNPKIVLFRGKKYVRTYKIILDGMVAVTKHRIAVLASGGIDQYDRATGAKIGSDDAVPYAQMVGSSAMVFFPYRGLLVLNRESAIRQLDGGKWLFRCFQMRDAHTVPCPAGLTHIAKINNGELTYVFDNNSFAEVDQGTAWLYSPTGRIIGAIPKVNVSIHVGSPYYTSAAMMYPTEKGVYYLQLTRTHVRVMYQEWER